VRIERATSVEDLVVGLAAQLVEQPPSGVLDTIEIAVPSRGMERWLTQRLSTELGALDGEAGVCANIAFPFPGTVVTRALAAVLGDGTEEDPWAPERLAWPVLAHLDDLPDDDVHAPLRAHLADGTERAERRRFPLARRIADLFDRYAMYRPDMVARWADGEDVDADGQPLPANVAWQPPLWRRLRATLGASPDARFGDALAALAEGDIAQPDALPAITIFGVQSLPPLHLRLLDALAGHTPVTIHALTPCATWTPGEAPLEPGQPLLASCGTAARDAQTALAPYERPADTATQLDLGLLRRPTAAADLPAPGASALTVLQGDIRADRSRGPRDLPPVDLAADDTSLQIHACHGPMRQLEVLREALLDLLERNRDLEPRDIVVLTPDIETYDPLIRAVFSDGDRPGDHDRDAATGVPALPFRVADRTVRDENVAARVLLEVLELVTARVGASAVLDLLATPPVAARFGLSAADVDTLPGWVLGTGISWGIDAGHRDELIGLDDASHTWAAGLDRLVLGAAMPDDGERMVGGVVPYDDVEGGGVELLGRLATATDALFACLRQLRAPRTVVAWRDALAEVVDTLLDPGPGPRRDPLLTAQLAAVREALSTMVEQSHGPDEAPSGIELTLEEVRSVLGSHLGQRGGRAQYGTGAVTFAGLVPLRNVPHEVVCLVGLDDGALPRTAHRHGFDLIAAQPRPGDPDERIEDRALLLDAVLSARRHLVITYTGHDPRTNEVQQPAVPVSELLDVVDRTFVADGWRSDPRPRAARDVVVTDHPLQPHSPRYFREPVSGEDPVPRGFDRRALAAARAAAGQRTPAAPFFPPERPLPTPTADELDPHIVELGDLVRFLEHPVRYLIQRRVGVSLGDDDRRLEDRDPIDLDGLQRWQLGHRLLGRRLAGDTAERWREHTLACGTVPVGGLGEVALDGIEELVDTLCAAVAELGDVHQLPVDVEVSLPGGAGEPAGRRRVVGSVELHGATVLHLSVSLLKHKHRVPVWTRLLAATAAAPQLEPRARLLGRARNTAGYQDLQLGPLAAVDRDDHQQGHDERTPTEIARDHLGALVDIYLRGHREPVPLLPDTSHEYVKHLLKGTDHAAAIARAHRTWEGTEQRPGEQADAYVVQAFGAATPLADIEAATGFAVDAERLWRPLLAVQGTT
jgi:exodeoxyribonuclease V gamma subunit